MAELSLDQFSALQGECFVLQIEDGEPLSAELIEARQLPQPPFRGRTPFSLLFKGPPSPVLPQRIYHLAHKSARAPLEIFLVAVSADRSGVCYEAIFT